MKLYITDSKAPSVMTLIIHILFAATITTKAAGANQEPLEQQHKLGSLIHQPMYVDEPRWIVLSTRTLGQRNTDDDPDDHFWVTRGKKRRMRSLSGRPPSLFTSANWADSTFAGLGDLEDISWTGRGNQKGLLTSALESDPFWVNRGKREKVTSVLEKDPFWVNRGKRSTDVAGFVDGKGEGQGLSDTKKHNDLKNKKSELASVLNGGDQFWVNRGKKSELQTLLNGGNDQFWVNRGKKSDLKSGLSGGEQFWVNRGKKSDLSSSLNNGDQFWVNRGKKSELSSLLNNGDQFWVNRGKKSELPSLLNNGDQFWVNRGKKSELSSLLHGGDQFWVNRGKKAELQSLLNGGDQFWVNRGKKAELQSLLNGGDQFWVNRGKKSELSSLLNGGDQFWVNRGKKSELSSLLNGGDQFWVNRGKKSELSSLLNNGDQFWVNRGKKAELESLLNGDQFWVNRGKKAELEPLLSGDRSWVNRGKKNDLNSQLSGEQFWVNRGKKRGSLPQNENENSGHPDHYADDPYPKLISEDFKNRFKKDPPQALLKPDPFWVNRGKRREFSETSKIHNEDPSLSAIRSNLVLKADDNDVERKWNSKGDKKEKSFENTWTRQKRSATDGKMTGALVSRSGSERVQKTNGRPDNVDAFKSFTRQASQQKTADVTKTSRQKRRATLFRENMQQEPPMPAYEEGMEDYLAPTENNVEKWWTERSSCSGTYPGDVKMSLGNDLRMFRESPELRHFGDAIVPPREPFWVNRGKKEETFGYQQDQEGDIPQVGGLADAFGEKRAYEQSAFASDSQSDAGELEGLAPIGETSG